MVEWGAMMHQDISRRQFLNVVFAFLGLFALNRFSVGGSAANLMRRGKAAYGNDAYGGSRL